MCKTEVLYLAIQTEGNSVWWLAGIAANKQNNFGVSEAPVLLISAAESKGGDACFHSLCCCATEVKAGHFLPLMPHFGMVKGSQHS